MTEEKKETRVTMIWPTALKEAVREQVGARGLTEFTLEAVRVRLQGEDRFQVQEERLKVREMEIDKLRWLCQLLADRYAIGGDYEDRVQGLMDVELPSWLSTEGWPAELAALVPKQDAEPVTISGTPKTGKSWFKAPDNGWTSDPEQAKQPLETVAPKVEPEVEPAPEEDEDLHRPMALTKPAERPEVKKLEPEGAGFKLEVDSDDFFARVQAKAAEKGVDLSGANLKSASSIERPEVTTEPASVLDVLPEPPTEVPVAPEVEVGAPDPNTCPKCGDVLVAGECWSCM